MRTCKTIPHLYNFIWNIIRKRNPNKLSKIFDNEINDCEGYFVEQINAFRPDVIICTHNYASGVIDKLIRAGKLDKKIITATVVFDFCLSPYWEFSTALDYVISPMEDMEKDLVAKGYAQSQIKHFGIPVRTQFCKACEKQKNENAPFTALMIAGGNGIGNTFKVFKNIVKYNPEINLIVVNGRNKKSFGQIESYIKKKGLTNVQNLGFVSNLEDYFALCDVIVSRCGGCGISEILCFGKPFIIREKMIINEKINKKMFIEKGCALGMKRVSDAGKLVKYLKENSAVRSQMAEACKEFAKPNATTDIVDFLVEEAQKREKQKI